MHIASLNINNRINSENLSSRGQYQVSVLRSAEYVIDLKMILTENEISDGFMEAMSRGDNKRAMVELAKIATENTITIGNQDSVTIPQKKKTPHKNNSIKDLRKKIGL